MTGMRKIAPVLLMACLPLFLVACGQRAQPIGSQTDPLPKNSVVITNLSFIPHRMVVTAGQTVTWKWDDSLTPHNVSFDNDGPHSPTQTNGSWSMRFDTPGTYTYRCTIHNNMVGKVVVRSS